MRINDVHARRRQRRQRAHNARIAAQAGDGQPRMAPQQLRRANIQRLARRQQIRGAYPPAVPTEREARLAHLEKTGLAVQAAVGAAPQQQRPVAAEKAGVQRAGIGTAGIGASSSTGDGASIAGTSDTSGIGGTASITSITSIAGTSDSGIGGDTANIADIAGTNGIASIGTAIGSGTTNDLGPEFIKHNHRFNNLAVA